jgi:hypothetical protein
MRKKVLSSSYEKLLVKRRLGCGRGRVYDGSRREAGILLTSMHKQPSGKELIRSQI